MTSLTWSAVESDDVTHLVCRRVWINTEEAVALKLELVEDLGALH